MILITSAAYISSDFASEIGLIPPAMLPLGNKRLYQHQHELLSDFEEDIYLSLPSDYVLDELDRKQLASLGITLVWVPVDLPLGQSIAYSWCTIAKGYDSLRILHGDTLFSEISGHITDAVSIHANKGYYPRAKLDLIGATKETFQNIWATEDEMVLSGYFSFSRPSLLVDGIEKNRGDFLLALEHYAVAKALTPLIDGVWYDFGHLNSYFRSRSEITTQRAFNCMVIDRRTVTKTSNQTTKITAEANWFQCLPPELKHHVPLFLEEICADGIAGYRLEYLYLLPLSDLYVFGALSIGSWKHIFAAVEEVLYDFRSNVCSGLSISLTQLDLLYTAKTVDRLTSYANDRGYSLEEKWTLVGEGSICMSMNELVALSAQYIKSAELSHLAVSHGDFCFSNLLFDTKVQCLKLIDPRGLDASGRETIYGDLRYDLAKLYHSIVGCYDFIISGNYELDIRAGNTVSFRIFQSDRHLEIQKLFVETVIAKFKIDEKEILAISIQLFLSMLPLHADRPDRQNAMIANALRLASKLLAI